MAKRKDPKARREAARQRMYHDLIFEAAEQVFADRGFESGTMQDVAAESGVSLKTLYATFPGKNELYDEIRTSRGEELMDAIASAADGAAGPLDELERSVRAYVEFLVAHPNFLRVMLADGMAWALAKASSQTEGVEGFARVLQQGMDEGLFHRGDPKLMARIGVAIMQVWLARIPEARDPDPAAIADEIMLQFRRLYLSGEADGDDTGTGDLEAA